ncbi:hypothetical protein ACFO1B_54835 [Dactylosporangium siamense]|uniref:Uncharacterized protein n=1 Tax=Dactylosporangium siamense TaxID=685454 RepID=A0A919UDL3_9ACTN|nr:hypothetical protein [Dactylosporangium siamense]GIG51594.1 hypothetical protein Dsi01nite_096350 [Dactylosporangium siamense]
MTAANGERLGVIERRLRAAAASVVRTLRCGLPAELVWPEYETAVAELDHQRVRVERQWPLLAGSAWR